MLISNIYPPIVQDTIPAFIRTGPCRIYFSLSAYNSIADIQECVQISLINQRTNASALKINEYPSGIMIVNINYDQTVRSNYNYYVEIKPSDLAEESFGLNQFYKVQLRFIAKSASYPPSNGTQLDQWLYNNMQYFSEWSKVCLIKGIEQPQIVLRGFDAIEETVLTSPAVDIVGELTYIQNKLEEKEYLKSYNIKLYQNNDKDNILMQTEEIYTNPYAPNELNYQLIYDWLDGINYIMVLTYTTNNLYTGTVQYKFTILQYGVDRLDATITATPDEENGRIKINIVSNTTDTFIGNITIRRTSSKSNFHKWEDVNTVAYITGTELNYIWYDMTIQSGVWYKYCAQKRNSRGDRGVIIQIDNPVMCLLDDIFLTRNDCQLKIQFNPTIGDFKYNVTESQQVTIGAKYPYVKRNGNNYFRTFSIGGLISSFIDSSNWYDPHFYDGEFHDDENELKTFTSKAEIYGESQELYNNYNDEKNITEYNDYIYEKEFRQKVYDFLYKHNVKLFRSTTEGNILIKLMNISFQPNETLGRRLYSFTATAVEVDEATIANYDKYDIQNIGTYEKQLSYSYETLGQLSGIYTWSDGNILDKIRTKYKRSNNKGFINNVTGLKWLRLQIDSHPYVITEKNGSLIKSTTTASNIDVPNTTVGYIVMINNVQTIIYPRMERRPLGDLENGSPATTITHLSSFELKEPNTFITDLRFEYPTSVTIDYIANIEEVEDTSGMASRINYYYKPGQLYGSFKPKTSLMRKIYNKYLLNYKDYYQRLLDVTGVQIEAQPNTVIYVKDSRDTDFNRHILENGYLQLRDPEVTIEDLYFSGIHLKDGDFTIINGSYNSFEDIENPILNGVYQITTDNENQYIYYHNNWYLFTIEHDVLCPIDGLVDYYCEVVKGVY